MADKNYNINLNFNAETKQAEAAMVRLTNQLKNLATSSPTSWGKEFSNDILTAQDEVGKLSIILEDCFNKNNGRLDINKFLVQTKQYGVEWDSVTASLKTMGDAGEAALKSLNQTIIQGQTGLVQNLTIVEKLYDQLVRTAKIQVSYAMLNSITSVFRDSYSYAQDLNKSLTDIQIVTQKSTAQMRDFAVEANKAAQSLSTTTTAYTNAALIYYQQGLGASEVAERTEATLKLSNVTGDTAQEVSDQMTAIWNNFDDGSKSLEYYADVLTALGAATASSTDEIADGLQQFAAVAETVGLSYEYASASLATVVANTRQSADVVGNAFKTIFARLESLSLGETLDDDTTLTKYTSALEKVGVSVQLQNGELKEMDDVLDELGEKWSILNDQQKNALAYTVAGARQYTNFIALMDSWDEVKENVEVANESEGTLNEQQNIYAKSWEASLKRIKAAWQEFYDLIINDDFFIGLNDLIADVINGITKITKGLGGLKGLLPVIASYTSKIFSKQIASGMTAVAGTAYSLWGEAGKKSSKFQAKVASDVGWDSLGADTSGGSLGDARNLHANNQANFFNQTKEMTEMAQQLGRLRLEREGNVIEQANTLDEKNYNIIQTTNSLQKIIEGMQNNTNLLDQLWKATDDKTITVGKAKKWTNDGLLTQEQYNSLSKGKTDKQWVNKEELHKYIDKNFDSYIQKNKEAWEKAIKEFEQQTNQDLENLNKTNKELSKQKQNLEQEKAQLGEKYKSDLKNAEYITALGVNDEALKQVEQDLVSNEVKQEELQKTLNQVSQTSYKISNTTEGNLNPDALNDKWTQTANTINQVIGAVTSLAATASTLEQFGKAISTNEISWGNLLAVVISFGSTVATIGPIIKNVIIPAIQALGVQVSVTLAESTLGISLIVTAVIGLITGIIGYLNGLQEAKSKVIEQEQEEIEQRKELISTTQDLSQSIQDLIDDYNSLQAAGESTYDTFEQLKEQIPELIESYKDLGLDDGIIQQLELLYEKGSLLGDYSEFNNYKTSVADAIVATQNTENVNREAANAGKNILNSIETNKGKWSGDNYTFSVKGASTSKYNDIFEKYGYAISSQTEGTGEYTGTYTTSWNQRSKTVNGANTSEVVNTIEELHALKKEIESASDFDANDTGYQNLCTLLSEVAETASSASTALNTYQTSQVSLINEDLTSATGNMSAQDYLKDLAAGEEGTLYQLAKSKDVEGLLADEEINQNIYNSDAGNGFGKVLLAQATNIASAVFDEMQGMDITDEAEYDQIAADKTAKWQEALAQKWDELDEEDKKWFLYVDLDGSDINEQIEEMKDQAATQEALSDAVAEGFESEDVENYAETLKAAAESSDDLADSLANDDSAAVEVAKDIMKMNRGIETLNSNYEDWIDILENSTDTSQEYSEAMADLKDALADVYDVSVDAFDNDFIADHLDEIRQVAQGDEEAIESLRMALAEDIIVNIIADNNVDVVASEYMDLLNQLAGLEIGAVDLSSFEDSLMAMIQATEMTVEQAEQLFNSLGFEGKFEAESVPTTTIVPEYRTTTKTYTGDAGGTEGDDEKGHFQETYTYSWTEQTGTKTLKGEAMNYAMTTDGSEPSPQSKVTGIKSLTKTSKGSMNNLSSSNKGGSSGSSSGSSKSKDAEADRYYTISRQVEKLNTQLDKLSEATDRAFGQAKLDAMQQEIDKYNELISANKEYLRQAEEYLASDRAKMESYGATFDANGIITNYEEMFAIYGNLEDSDWSDDLSKYEDSLSKVEEETEAIAEAMRNIYDLQLESIEYKLEFQMDINDQELEYLDYLLEKLDDAAYDSAQSIAILGKEIDNTSKKVQALNENAVELLDVVAPGKGNEYYQGLLDGTINLQDLANSAILNDPNFNASQWFDDIKSLQSDLIDAQKQYQEQWEDYIDTMKEFWDTWEEEFDKQEDQLDHLTSIASFYKDLVDIVGQDTLGLSDNTMARLDRTIAQGNTDKAIVAYKEFLAAQNTLKEAEEKDLDDELLEYYKEKVDEAQEALMDAQKEAAQALKDEYDNALERIISNAKDAFSGLGDYDWMNQLYDLEKTRNDLYMDTYEKAYQLNKLNTDIARSIDEIDNLDTKQKLASLMDEINEKQASGVKMSEYEYEAYRKEYELLLAIQALEDAKNAKNQVRMSRDNEGNMSYVYTADQDAINDATDNYNDVAYQFAQLNQGQAMEAEEQYLQYYQEMMDKIAEVGEEHREEIYEQYAEILEYWKEQGEISYEWNAALMDQTGLDYWNLTTKFEDSVLAHTTGCQTWEDLETRRKETTEQALADMAEADQAYHDNLADLLDQTGENAEDMESRVNDSLDDINDNMEDTMDNVEDMADTFEDSLDDIMDQAESFEDKWDSVIQSVIAQNDALIASLQELINYYYKLNAASGGQVGSTSYSGGSGSGSSNKGGSRSGGTNNTTIKNPSPSTPTKTVKSKVVDHYGAYHEDGSGQMWRAVFYKVTYSDGSTKIVNDSMKVNGSSGSPYGTRFASGGYTGEWGASGKWAILDQKELVLNETDTSNMLAIVDSVRSITDSLTAAHGANVDLASAGSGIMAGLGSFDQNVHITAEFPNATDRTEIQAAFSELLNRASQYINKKS